MMDGPGAIQSINSIKRWRVAVSMLPRPGTIGGSVPHRDYVKYLVDRCNISLAHNLIGT